MKKNLEYWIPTGLLAAMFLAGSIMYATDISGTIAEYQKLGFPAWVMYFNWTAKFLGIIVLVAPVAKWLKEFVYAGYLYVLLMALIAHMVIQDNQHWGAVVGLVLWSISFWQWRKMQS